MSTRTRVVVGGLIALALTVAIGGTLLDVQSRLWTNAESRDRDRYQVLTGPAAPTPGLVLAAALSPAPSPAPAAAASCGPPLDAEYLAQNQILSYYGNPYVPAMGILGELEPAQLVAELKGHAEKYDALNGDLGVRPALHFVFATAQPEPGPDGSHLQYVARNTLKQYINLACREGLLFFIDLQIGRSDVATEVQTVLKYLEHSHVHLAIDPEFAMPPGEIPGEAIGSIDASDVNTAQQLLQEFLQERGMEKMLIVHRFTDNMITNADLIEDSPQVHLVIDMDGFGPVEVKQVKFGWYAEPAEYAGIKLFFRQDDPLMSEEEVLELEPDVIIYQ